MKILQVGSGMARWGGSERYLMDATVGLTALGEDVTVACAPGSMLDKWCKEENIPHIPLEMRHFSDWVQLPSFVRAYRKGRYDIVHTHGAFDYFVPALAGRLARVPAIVMSRHLPHPFRSKWRAFLCSGVLYDKIVAVSQYVAGVMRESGVDANRIAMVYNGVKPPPEGTVYEDPRPLREQFDIPADGRFLASAGRLTTGKGFGVLIDAIGILKKQGFPVYALIYGHGELKEKLLQQVAELGIGELVRLPGYRTDVWRLWREADIAAIASDGPEALGYTIIEAQATGLPVVTSRMGGQPEVVGDAGIVVEPGNAGALAEGIRQMFSQDLQVMRAKALERSRGFTTEESFRRLREVYRSLLR